MAVAFFHTCETYGFSVSFEMDIGFGPNKDVTNIRDHGASLAFGEIVLMNKAFEVNDTRHAYGETWMKAFGQVNGLWFECVYTLRGTITHIISVHRVREKEAKRWLAK